MTNCSGYAGVSSCNSSPSLRDILRNCANIQSYESLPIEDFNDVCLSPCILDCAKMIITNPYSISSNVSTSSYTSDDSLGDAILEENGRISLAYENLRTIPRRIADKFAAKAKFLDLSHNSFQNLSFLTFFEELDTLILDRNINLDVNTLPYLPNLKILWINNCDITNITDWIHRIERQCPSLEHLSVMGNPGIKTIFNYSTLPIYTLASSFPPTLPTAVTTDYREYILYVLPHLKYLDGVPRNMLFIGSDNLRSSSSQSPSNEQSTSDSRLYHRQQPQQNVRKASPTLSFKDLFRLRQRKKSYNSSSTN